MSSHHPIRVFLVDDVPELRMLVRLTLTEDPDIVVVGEAENGRAGVEGVAQAQPIQSGLPRNHSLAGLMKPQCRSKPSVRPVAFAQTSPASGRIEAELTLGFYSCKRLLGITTHCSWSIPWSGQ